MNERGPREDRLIGRNAISIRVRWLALAGVLSLAWLTYLWQSMPEQIGALTMIGGLFAIENLIYEAHLRYVRAHGRLSFSKTFTEWQSLPDFVLLAVMVHFTGGIDSPYLYLPLLSLLMSGSLIQQPFVVVALASTSAVLTALVVLSEAMGLATYYPFAAGTVAADYATTGYLVLSLGVYCLMLFVSAFGSLFLSQLLGRRSQELRESEERYRDLVENIGDLVFAMDTDGRLTFVNHTVAARTGYTADELIGKPVSEFLAPESRGVFKDAAERGYGRGLHVRGLRVVGLTRDGHRFHLEVNMSRIRRHHRVVGARGVARDISDRKQMEDELSQRLSDVARLYQASAQLSASLSVEETLEAVVRQAVEATHGVWASVILVDNDGRPELHTAVGDVPQPSGQVMRPNGVSAHVLASREPAIFPSTRDAADVLSPVGHSTEDRAAICLPLLEKARPIGVMWVNYGQPRQFTVNDVHLLQTFADQIASAICNARLYAREQHRVRLLEAVSTVGREAVSSLDLDTLLARTVSMLNQDLGYPVAAIMLLDDACSGAGGAGRHVRAFPTALPPSYRQPVTIGLSGQAVREGATIMAEDVHSSPNYLAFFPETRGELDIPLRYGGTVLGVISLQSDRPRAFPPEDVAVLEILADQIAIAINNARLYQEVTERAQATTMIQEASMAMTATLTADQVLEKAIHAAMRVGCRRHEQYLPGGRGPAKLREGGA